MAFIRGGALSKKEKDIYVNTKYDMIPPYFHGVSVEEKQFLMEIMEQHNNWFQLECVQEIRKSMSTPLSDLQSLCVCVTLYYQHPEMIDMELTP